MDGGYIIMYWRRDCCCVIITLYPQFPGCSSFRIIRKYLFNTSTVEQRVQRMAVCRSMRTLPLLLVKDSINTLHST